MKIAVGVLAVVLVAGGAYLMTRPNGTAQVPAAPTNTIANSGFSRERGSSTAPRLGTPITLADIAVGDHVMVNGTANTDGSIAAASVLVGNLPERQFTGSSTVPGGSTAPTAGTTGGTRSFADFQNMTDAQRQAFIAERQAQGGSLSGTRSGTTGGGRTFSRGGTTINGTVSSVEGDSIIVAIEGQGTRLVMTSSSTVLRKIAPPSAASSTPAQ
jgi:hypothetical protein